MSVHKVKSLSNLKLEFYNEGDLFITKRSIAILANNKLNTLATMNDINQLKKEVEKDEKK